jgi:hypothetical protein
VLKKASLVFRQTCPSSLAPRNAPNVQGLADLGHAEAPLSTWFSHGFEALSLLGPFLTSIVDDLQDGTFEEK